MYSQDQHKDSTPPEGPHPPHFVNTNIMLSHLPARADPLSIALISFYSRNFAIHFTQDTAENTQ